MTDFVLWITVGVIAWLLFTVLRGRWPDFYARSEAWTAEHPWMNASIFAIGGLVVAFIAGLAKGWSVGETAVASVAGAAVVFLLFLLMSIGNSKRHRK